MRICATAAALALLCGCAASGVRITEQQLSTLRIGQTTADDVIAQFGQPTSRVRMADGTLLLQYVYGEASVRAASFIPIVGAIAGGADVRSNMAALRFTADGKLADFSSASSQYGTGRGVSAGNIDTSAVPQPRQ